MFLPSEIGTRCTCKYAETDKEQSEWRSRVFNEYRDTDAKDGQRCAYHRLIEITTLVVDQIAELLGRSLHDIEARKHSKSANHHHYAKKTDSL